MAKLLIAFKPPNADIDLGLIRIRGMSDVKGDPAFENAVMTGWEVSQLFRTSKAGKTRPTQSMWAVLDVPDSSIAEDAVVTLLDLLTGQYRYELAKARRRALPLSLARSDAPPRLPRHKLTNALLNSLRSGTALLKKRPAFGIGLNRWAAAYVRHQPLDTVLDCCASLEAVLKLDAEKRLRLALCTYHFLERDKRNAFKGVYRMYGIRNDFIHGGGMPSVSDHDQDEFIEIVATVLRKCVQVRGIPTAEELSKRILRQYSG